MFAILIDPDKQNVDQVAALAQKATEAKVDFIFVGGSLLTNDRFEKTIETIKSNTTIPVVIFPGNNLQINKKADAILLLSLISGRNAEMLIGKHVIAAPYLKESKLEIIPCGYMLVESGRQTTAMYMSNTIPIPHDKNEIALCTAMAGEMLGLKIIYMDAGSGAEQAISTSMIKSVKQNLGIPLIIGGGIHTPEDALSACRSGADIIVVGNAIEKDQQLVSSIAKAIHSI